MACVRLTVRGRVQGVGFRAYVQDSARGLDLTGWVRNRKDGTVEVWACGPEAVLTALSEAVAKGPPGAVVRQVTSEAAPSDLVPESFLIRYDET